MNPPLGQRCLQALTLKIELSRIIQHAQLATATAVMGTKVGYPRRMWLQYGL